MLVDSFKEEVNLNWKWSLKIEWGLTWLKGFPCGSDSKASAYNVGDPGSIRESGSSPGGGNSNPFQYSCLENPMGGGAWQATVHGVAKSQTRLSDFTFSLLTRLVCRFWIL